MKDNKYVVLSVDDDIDVLSTMRIVLEANGFYNGRSIFC